MSSFFRTGETSSSEYTETESSEEEQITQQAAKQGRDVRGIIESSDDDEGARVAKSQKDKMFELSQGLCDRILKFVKNDEIAKAADSFKQLTLVVSKAQAVFSRSGFPQCIVKTITQVIILLKDVAVSSLDVANQKALKELIMQIDKFKKGHVKLFDQGNKILQQPKSSLFAGSSDDDEDDDEDEEDEEDEEAELTDELTEEEESEDDDDDIDLSKFAGKITRDFWLKKVIPAGTIQKSQAEVAKAEAEEKEKQRLLKQKQRQADAAASKKEDLIAENGQVLTRMEKQRLELLKKRANEKITPEIMQKKLREIVAARGRRSETQEAIAELLFLKDKAQDAATTLRIQTLLALFYFDQNTKAHSAMTLQHWRESYNQITEIIHILNKDKAVVRLVEDDQFDDSAFSSVDFDEDVENALNDGSADPSAQKAWYAARNEALKQAKERAMKEQSKQAKEAELGNVTFVEGNLYSYLYKLSTEYYTGLQLCDAVQNSTEYINRLREQTRLLTLFESAYQYYVDIDKSRLSKRIAELILEYTYFYYVPEQDVLFNPTAPALDNKVDHWASIVLSSDEPRSRIKALLFQLYYAAIHNKYQFAKDRLASSYLVDTIHDLDIDTRILYNRTLTQIGLAAFRAGDYKGSINYLGDLLNRSQRIKELLAQGVARADAGVREDIELEAKKRVYPSHQHINLDYLDAVHLVSAMIVEIPNMSEQGMSRRVIPNIADQRRIVSKTFRRHYSYFLERLARTNITPSIDSARDAILAAAHEISKGNWSTAIALLISDVKILFKFNPKQASFIKEALTNAIKIASLKSYLFTHSAVYSSISLSTFTAMFGLPEKTITAIINAQAYNENIHAAWDADSKTNDDKENPILVISSHVNQSSNPLGASYVEKLNSLHSMFERIQSSAANAAAGRR